MVSLASTVQRDLIVREFATLLRRWSLRLRLGLLSSQLRALLDIAGVSASDWSDHKDRIGNAPVIFTNFCASGNLW